MSLTTQHLYKICMLVEMFSLTMLWEITLNFKMIPCFPASPTETGTNSAINQR